MNPSLAIIICTHNPRLDYLGKVLQSLDSLKGRKGVQGVWIIDNASTKEWNLSQLAHKISLPVQCVREDRVGLTYARLRGFKESRSDLIVYVDDDNVLDEDYLEGVLEIEREFPKLGAWGCGELRGVYEQEPDDWIRENASYLTIHKVESDRWSNLAESHCFPCGAGLVLRRNAAESYFSEVEKGHSRGQLDRAGKSLISCGDMDLVWSIVESGWGVGRFTKLKMDHLMSASRVQEDYFLRLVESQWRSSILLKYLHGAWSEPAPDSVWKKWSRRRYLNSLNPGDRKIAEAKRRGEIQALEDIRQHQRTGTWNLK